ncbi:MAG TPA: MurT ligase domain-containing protein [Acidimicrobiales bacterium]|nr:MurT ligase domain-containing protein [Acidimicrobiales bacterium]
MSAAVRAQGRALPARTRMAAGVGGLVGALSRRVGAGSGTVIGGRVTLALDRAALARLARDRPVGLVSGTNGKTTTTQLLTAALAAAGPACTNIGGANLPPGLVAALSAARDAPPSAPAALEVDEAWLGAVVAATHPVVVALLNLSRDQLDRVSEVRMLGARWRAAMPDLDGAVVVANADDPIVAWAASAARSVRWVAAGQPWRADATGCPQCEGRIAYDGEDWACACGLRRPRPDVWLEEGGVAMADGRRIPVALQLPGRFNLGNAAVAATAAAAMGVSEEKALAAMASTADVFGRYQVVDVRGVRTRLLLAKNPAGWVGIFDLLVPAPAPVVVAINARIADGRDPSWLWDVPFERLRGRRVVATGERSADLAVRLRYAGVDHVRVSDVLDAVERAQAPEVDFVGNYTAFQDLRAGAPRTRMSRVPAA